MFQIFKKIYFLYEYKSSFLVIYIFLSTKIKNIFIKSKIKYEKRKHRNFLTSKIISADYFSSQAFYFYNF